MNTKLLNISALLVALCLILSCQDSDCTEKIKQLEAEIADMKKGETKNRISNTSEKREETIERYDDGSKKLVVTYMGSGSHEVVVKKISYYSSGQKKESENYKQNELNGPYFEYYRNGQASVESSYLNGQRHGDYIEYYFDGTTWEEGTFSNGEYDGKYITYFKNRQIKSQETYKNGDRIEATWFNSKGEVEFKN